MNADGFLLLERLKKNDDPDLLKLIDRCAWFARTRQRIEEIEFKDLQTRDKVFLETLTVHLLQKMLHKMT